jgi:hypothetical protein
MASVGIQYKGIQGASMSQERDAFSIESGVTLAHLHKFNDGTGKLSDFASFLAEVACGMSREQARKRDQDDFNAMTDTEQVEWHYNDRILSGSGLNRPPPKQWRFDVVQKAFLRHFIRTAQKNGWEVTDEWGVDLDPPTGQGYVDVRLVHDLYAGEKSRKKARLAEGLRSLLSNPIATTPELIAMPQADEPSACMKADWPLKPEVQRNHGLSRPVHTALKAAHDKGLPMPKAKDVVEYLRANKVADIVSVSANGCRYVNSQGKEVSADLIVIQGYIEELTTRKRRKAAAQDPPKPPSTAQAAQE